MDEPRQAVKGLQDALLLQEHKGDAKDTPELLLTTPTPLSTKNSDTVTLYKMVLKF